MMTPEQWQRAKELFGLAIECDAADRRAFLDETCDPADVDVRRQVEALLGAHDSSERFLETPAAVIGSVAARSILAEGHKINRYRVHALLGAGGMGQVYLAEDPRLGRKVALKVLPRALAADADRLKRFEQEARTASALSHPNVCVIYEIGETDARPEANEESHKFIAMEYVAGESLRTLMDRHSAAGTRIPMAESLRIAQQIASGLAAAHSAGVVHRDIKPENVMVRPDGLVKLLDFGLAKPAGRQASEPRAEAAAQVSINTEPGMVLGTIQYMSPEQARGLSVDARTDIWSLGAILYEMLSGRASFVGETPSDVMVAVIAHDPPSLGQLAPDIPQTLVRIVERALTKDRALRFQSAAELGDEIHACQRLPRPDHEQGPELGVALVHAIPAVSSGGSGIARRPFRWIGLLTVASVVALAITWSARRGDDGTGSGRNQAIAQKYVVAVLPFENLSSDTANNYVSAGMTDEISGQLSQISDLRVLARSAVLPYRDKPDRLLKMVTDLGVGSVVEGSVRADRSRARITVQLIDARLGQVIWSTQYDRPLTDIFAVQREIGLSLTSALETSLTPAEARRAGRPPTVDLAAYELYMRAIGQSANNPASLRLGVETLRRAIRLDSTFARAYARLARTYLFLGLANPVYIDSGFTAAKKAIELDPQLAFGYFSLGGIQAEQGRLLASRTAFLKAHELDPNFFVALTDLSYTEESLGRFDEALHWAQRAFLLNPATVTPHYHLAAALLRLDADSVTERFLLRAERALPQSVRIQSQLATLDLLRRRDADAMDRARRLVAREPDDTEGQYFLAELALMTGAPDAEALLEPTARYGPRARAFFLPESMKTLHALSLARRGARAHADSLWTEAVAVARQDVARGHEKSDRHLEIAAISAVRGDTASALEWLDRGYRAGWRDYRVLARDPFFDGLRSNVRFRRIVLQMKSDVSVMRQRAMAANDTLFLVKQTRSRL